MDPELSRQYAHLQRGDVGWLRYYWRLLIRLVLGCAC